MRVSRARRGASRDPGGPPPAGVLALAAGSAGYPRELSALPDPPAVLYLRGDLPSPARAVAIVGTRAATPYGLRVARALGSDLARLGITVVSGLARGVDAAAHEGALDAGGRSVAVIPAGLDAVVPAHHAALAARCAASGALVSEWRCGPPPFRGAFVTRNRIIAALSAATVVVEAGVGSGALATAAAARALGRTVFAVPGDVDRPTSFGAHALLRAGASLCERASDVMAVLPRGAGEGPEARLLAVLDGRPRTLEILAEDAGLAVDTALAALMRLRLSGDAVALPGPRFTRAGGAA